jgi:hypothetical protein
MLNKRQLCALWVGIGVICLLLLFPPQEMMPNIPSMMSVLQTQFTAGATQTLPTPAIRYAFLFAPPAGSVGLDWPRLLLPVVVLLLLTFGAVVTLQDRKREPTA